MKWLEALKRKADPTAGPMIEEKGASSPLFHAVGPGQARATPREYSRLAEEGYRQNVIAYRAVNMVARGVSSIPLVLEQNGERLSDHPLLDLLASPNPTLGGRSFMYHLVGHYLIAGNSYTLAVGPGVQPKELWLMRPDSVKIIEGGDGTPAGYRQQAAGKKRDFAPEHVMHWRSFNPLNDWYGLAPLEAAALAVDNHNEGSRWNLALIQNGGRPTGILYQEGAEAVLTDGQFNRLKSEVEEAYSGARNAGRPLLLEGGLKWQEMSLSPSDMDWSTGKNTSAREIAMAFGVPPQMLGIPDSQTYSNYSEARLSVWEDTIIPFSSDLANLLSRWLCPLYGEGLYLKPNLEGLPALEAKREQLFRRLSGAAFMSEAEKREAAGLAVKPPADKV